MWIPGSDSVAPGTTNPVTLTDAPWPGNSTMLYEYRTLWYGNDIAGDVIERLNELGREGWHVVANADKRLILERPITTSRAGTLVGPIDP